MHLDPNQQVEEELLPKGTLVDGRYVIEGFLGRGGFAIVYKAVQTTLDRPAALKVLDLHGNSVEVVRFRERFANEAKLAARLEHPNVVRIFDYGFVEQSQQPYIAMELLQGHDLESELLEHGPLELERAMRLFDGVLDALGHAHEKGIVHKDLKPSNLFICEPNTPRERMVVLDYGIARLYDSPDAKLTQTNQYTGTPAYAAPEYIHSQTVSPALDVYQMGLIIGEALTGNPIVQASSPMAYFVAHCNGQQRVDPKLLGTPLGEIIRRSVSVDPLQRYDSGASFKVALEQLDLKEQARLMAATFTGEQEVPLDLSVSGDSGANSAELFAPTLDSVEMPKPLTQELQQRTPAPTTEPLAPKPPTIEPMNRKSSNLGMGCLVLGLLGGFGAIAVVVALVFGLFMVRGDGSMRGGSTIDESVSNNNSDAVRPVSKLEEGRDKKPLSKPTKTVPAPQPIAMPSSSSDPIKQALYFQRNQGPVGFKFAQLHRGTFSLMAMTEPRVHSYLHRRTHDKNLESIAESAGLEVDPTSFEYFLKALEVAAEVEPDRHKKIGKAQQDYIKSFHDVNEATEQLDNYWRLDRAWEKDRGTKAKSLDVRLEAKWKAYLNKREAFFNALYIANTEQLEQVMAATSPATEPLEHRLLRLLIEMQPLQRALMERPRSKEASGLHESFQTRLRELREPRYKASMNNKQRKILKLLEDYMDSSRNYMAESKARHDKGKMPEAQIELLDGLHIYSFTGNYISAMEMHYSPMM
ncbi:MAG: protein kinase [Myxococcota bacterium]|jgi:serine/threonine protein kinase|nr:protein kinase [Myxococcota bacterium]